MDYFGGRDINRDFYNATNIIFSNGEFDPWRAGGITYNVTEDWGSIAVYIEKAAHHLDLRAPNDTDPDSVKVARDVMMATMKKWINEYEGTTIPIQ